MPIADQVDEVIGHQGLDDVFRSFIEVMTLGTNWTDYGSNSRMREQEH